MTEGKWTNELRGTPVFTEGCSDDGNYWNQTSTAESSKKDEMFRICDLRHLFVSHFRTRKS